MKQPNARSENDFGRQKLPNGDQKHYTQIDKERDISHSLYKKN